MGVPIPAWRRGFLVGETGPCGGPIPCELRESERAKLRESMRERKSKSERKSKIRRECETEGGKFISFRRSNMRNQ